MQTKIAPSMLSANFSVMGETIKKSSRRLPAGSPFLTYHWCLRLRRERKRGDRKRYSGDDSIRAPPLPIPNREVKPYHADGTAKAGE